MKNKLLRFFSCLLVLVPLLTDGQLKKSFRIGDTLIISEAVLKDKIKGRHLWGSV